jgi:hypothetical protein
MNLQKLNDFRYNYNILHIFSGFITFNWLSSWAFLAPVSICYHTNYCTNSIQFGISQHTLAYVLIPSLIRHAHIKGLEYIITPIEKFIIISSIAYIIFARYWYIYTSSYYYELLSYFDLLILISVSYIAVAYFIFKMSQFRYGYLWHSTIHVIGAFGILCDILAFEIY